jgi:hypothetical protein
VAGDSESIDYSVRDPVDCGVLVAKFARMGLPVPGESVLLDSSARRAGVLVLARFVGLLSFRVSGASKRLLPLVLDDVGRERVRPSRGCPPPGRARPAMNCGNAVRL